MRLLAPAIFLNLKQESYDFNGLVLISPRARAREDWILTPARWHASRLSIPPASMWGVSIRSDRRRLAVAAAAVRRHSQYDPDYAYMNAEIRLNDACLTGIMLAH